jgi:hypothetical protein
MKDGWADIGLMICPQDIQVVEKERMELSN